MIESSYGKMYQQKPSYVAGKVLSAHMLNPDQWQQCCTAVEAILDVVTAGDV